MKRPLTAKPRTATAVLLTCIVMNLSEFALGQNDTRKPSVGRDQTLQRFVSELVEIVPGEGKFPESIETPGGVLRPDGPFQISRYETTQEIYQEVMGHNPSRWKGPRNSAESMSRLDVEKFCRRLSETLRQEGLIEVTERVRLPNLVEWEYSCRAGSTKEYCFGDLSDSDLDEFAWHHGNAAGNDPAVGVLKPNAFGLYDCHGYLWEFVDGVAGKSELQRPSVWAMGGSWRDDPALLSADSKIQIPQYAVSDAIGFRCVVSGSAPTVKIPPDR